MKILVAVQLDIFELDMKLVGLLDIHLNVVAVDGIVVIDYSNLHYFPLFDCDSLHNCMDFDNAAVAVAVVVLVVVDVDIIDNCHLVTNIPKLRSL